MIRTVTKSIKLDDNLVENLELVIRGLNEKTGADVYDFSNVVRTAINQYLSGDYIREILEASREKAFSSKKEMLLVAESSLSKDWFRTEEDKAWANL